MNRLSRLPVKLESHILRNENRKSRASSSSRAGSYSLQTPSLRRSKSSASLRSTPQSCQSVRTRSNERQKCKKKDTRPIQDKRWQKETLDKLQHYFQNDPNGMVILNQGKNLRSITITMFVQLVNVVLHNLDQTFEEITLKNYLELVPKYLTMLMYPGIVKLSMLKTVNTIHSWPHVLALLSWLVGLHNRIKIAETLAEENFFILPEHEDQELQIQQFESKLKIEHYASWDKDKEIKGFEEKYIMGLKEIFHFSQEEADNLKKTYEQLKEQKAVDKAKQVKLYDQIAVKEKEIDELTEEKKNIDDVCKQQEEYIRKMEEKIENIKKDNQKLKEETKKYNLKVDELEEKVKAQPMSREQKKKKLLEIEEMNSKKTLVYNERKKLQEINDKVDIRLSQIKRNIEEKVSKYNLELIELGVQHAQLKKFVLKNEKLLMPDFYEHVQETVRLIETFRSDINIKNKAIEDEIKANKVQVNDIERRCTKLLQKKQILEAKLTETELMLEEEQKKADEEENKRIDMIKFLKDKIEEFRNNLLEMQKIKAEICLIAKKCNDKKAKLKAKSTEMVKFFENLEQEVKNTVVPEYQEIRNIISRAVIQQHENLRFDPPKNISEKDS